MNRKPYKTIPWKWVPPWVKKHRKQDLSLLGRHWLPRNPKKEAQDKAQEKKGLSVECTLSGEEQGHMKGPHFLKSKKKPNRKLRIPQTQKWFINSENTQTTHRKHHQTNKQSFTETTRCVCPAARNLPNDPKPASHWHSLVIPEQVHCKTFQNDWKLSGNIYVKLL